VAPEAPVVREVFQAAETVGLGGPEDAVKMVEAVGEVEAEAEDRLSVFYSRAA
jgi:hypothetical protein